MYNMHGCHYFLRWGEQQVDLQQILAAQEIWKTGSITRAAKNLFMGQPNLSRSLQELEEEVGFPIFDRSSRGVRPTVEGLTFLHRSQEVVQAMDSLRQIYGSEKREPVRILIPQVFYAVGCLADFLAQEARKSPISGGSLPHLNMEQVPADQIEERVGRSEQTLGIVRFEEGRKHILYDRWRRQGLIWKELMRFPTRVTLSKQHPLAKRETLQPQELYPYTELRGQYDHISRPELEKNESCQVKKGSSYLVTEPYGGVEQDDFLNACLELRTLLDPQELLDELHRGEQLAHRERLIHWGPRTLDLDILLYDDEVFETDTLIVPHVEMQLRDFVLRPMAEIAPNLRHPVLKKTMTELLRALTD